MSKTYSCRFDGFTTKPVLVEAKILPGFSSFSIVGLAGTSIQEARERIRASLSSMHITLPPGRIIVNLYPGDVHKGGTQWDLSIAVALLSAMGQVDPNKLTQKAFLGELSLDGKCRPVPGAFAMASALKEEGILEIYLPAQNLAQCQILEGVRFYPCHSLREVVEDLQAVEPIAPVEGHFPTSKPVYPENSGDYADLKGREVLKRVIEIAVAGRHSLLLIGPPGVGKSMAMQRLPSILPPLTPREQLAVYRIHSTRSMEGGIPAFPPIRQPHHTTTERALIGGGLPPMPGEITLAHHGVLLLEEMLQFPHSVLEALRQPLETQRIALSRGNRRLILPCDFQLLATANPCACGYYGDPLHACSCRPAEWKRYRQKLSGPLLNRFDMVYEVHEQPKPALSLSSSEKMSPDFSRENGSYIHLPEGSSEMNSQTMRSHIRFARERQQMREDRMGTRYNARISDAVPESALRIGKEEKEYLQALADNYQLSRRVQRRLLLVARTIADLAGDEQISGAHLTEALQYRRAAENWLLYAE